MIHVGHMRKRMTAKEALANYDVRLNVQAKLRCSMNTIVAALHGKPTRQRNLRETILAELKLAGVDIRTIGDGHGK